jgi:uncharacterized DUF497 family protein
MKFEYYENKSLSNKQKHGIDFEEAKELWKDDRLLEIKTSFSTEERYINIGKIGNKFYTAVITYRDDKIRLISVRRARVKEIEIYES